MLSDHAYLHRRITSSIAFNGRPEDYVVGQYAACAESTGQGMTLS